MFKNVIWDFAGKFSVQLISFGISVVLTRLLSPSEFGVMGMAMAIIIFAHIFLDLGFNRAIIQSKQVSQEQYATIFFLNTGIAILLTVLCYLLAGPLSSFYKVPLIAPVFRAMSFLFLINGLNLVPAALLYKRLQLKLNSILTLIASVTSGIAGILMAYNGYGIWSLVTQSLLSALLLMLSNFWFARWLPILRFSFASIKPLWSYGSKLFAAGLLDNFYTRLDVFIIGKIFTISTLGFYTRAQSMDSFIRQISVNSIMGALFPYIAKHQDDKAYLLVIYKKYLHMILFMSIALSGTLFLSARYIFLILFTPKWLYAADLFRLMSIIGFVWPVSSIMCNIIAGVGNSSAFFRLEVVKKILFLPVYLLGFWFGLQGFLICFIAANLIALVINAWYVNKELSITVIAQLKIVIQYLAIAILAIGISWSVNSYTSELNNWWNIILLSALFNLVYLAAGYFLHLDAISTINQLFLKFRQYLYDKRHKNFPTAI